LINEASVQAVNVAEWSNRFRRPLYDSYSFARIPATVRGLLTGVGDGGLPADTLGPLAGDYDTVILLFVDAFGWRFVQQYRDEYPFLRRFADEGVIAKLTSQFPSTTAAHVTTMQTGLPVGQHGVYEWYFYEPLLDTLIAPLLFSFAGDRDRETLTRSGIAAGQLFPAHTLYQDLAAAGVQSYILNDRAFVHSTYTETVGVGATLLGHRNLPEALVQLRQLRAAQTGKAYYYLYFAGIDTTGHQYGPDSPFFTAEVDAFLTIMERQLAAAVTAGSGRTLVLMTADHGQVAVDPATTVYLDETLPALRPLLMVNRAGQPLVPAGSSRDFFLHIRPDALADAKALLTDHLAGRAEVWPVADLMAQGFFGPTPLSPVFLGRVGNVVILPYAGESVWWKGDGRFKQAFYGAHGGLTPEEMETVLLAQVYE